MFCFDSFGKQSFDGQIPLSFLTCNVIFENASLVNTNSYIDSLSLNYNEINTTLQDSKKDLKLNTQFYYFSQFIKQFSYENNVQNLTVSYNRLPYQRHDTVLCGGWCAYFASLFFQHFDKIKQNIDLSYFKHIFASHFQEINVFDQRLIFEFRNFIRHVFLKYCDITAKKAFLYDIQDKEEKEISTYLHNSRSSSFEFNPIRIFENEINILQNNENKALLKQFDWLRTEQNTHNSSFLHENDLNKLPFYWIAIQSIL